MKSCDTNACIEVEYKDGFVWINKSTTATPAEWLAFVAGVKNGEFDLRAHVQAVPCAVRQFPPAEAGV